MTQGNPDVEKLKALVNSKQYQSLDTPEKKRKVLDNFATQYGSFDSKEQRAAYMDKLYGRFAPVETKPVEADAKKKSRFQRVLMYLKQILRLDDPYNKTVTFRKNNPQHH